MALSSNRNPGDKYTIQPGHVHADRYVDVTEHIDTSVAALKEHKSQVSEEDADKYMRQWRSSIGEKVGMQYAEAFKRFKMD